MQAEQPSKTNTGGRWHGRRDDVRQADDDTLLRWLRAGSDAAATELYTRHRRDALRYANQLTYRYLDPGAGEDILAEAIRRIFTALAAGAGPTSDFRRYLFASIRSTAVGRVRDRKQRPARDPLLDVDDRTQDIVDALAASDILKTLPHRWRHVLWATAVEQLSPAELAPRLGMQPNGVAVLAHRARRAFRDAYLHSDFEDYPSSGVTVPDALP